MFQRLKVFKLFCFFLVVFSIEVSAFTQEKINFQEPDSLDLGSSFFGNYLQCKGSGKISVNCSSGKQTAFQEIDLDGKNQEFNIFGTQLGNLPVTVQQISNGALTKTGNYILQFLAPNSYSLGTFLQEGTIAVAGSGLMTSSGALTMSSNTIFDIAHANAQQVIGDFSGDGSVVLGNNILILGGDLNTEYNGIFQGNSGFFEKKGTGYLRLTNTANALQTNGDFGVKITEGTLEGTLDNLQQNILLSSGTLIFNLSSTGNFIYSILGSPKIYSQRSFLDSPAGNFSSIGQGSLTFPENSVNYLTGVSDISGGGIVINGKFLGDGQMNISSSSVISGTGYIAQTIDVLGKWNITRNDQLQAYKTLLRDELGLLTGSVVISGDLNFLPGSEAIFHFTTESADSISIIKSTNANGDLNISPGAILSLIPKGSYYSPFRKDYVIFTTEGLISGEFELNNPYSNFFKAVVQYGLHQINIDIRIIEFHPYAIGKNNQSLSRCLDAQNPAPNTDLYQLIFGLRSAETLEQFNAALNQLQPTDFTQLTISAQNNNLYFNSLINQRLRSLDLGCLNKSANGFWLTPYGGYNRQKFFQASSNSTNHNLALAAGYDRSFGQEGCLGLAASYNQSNTNFDQHRGSAQIQDVYGCLYGSYQSKYFSFLGQINGSYNHFLSNRNVNIDFLDPVFTDFTVNRTAHGNHIGWQGSTQIQIHGKLHWNWLEIWPFFNNDYFYMVENAFTETSAQSVDLRIKRRLSNLWIYEGGVQLARCFTNKELKWRGYIAMSEMRESRFKGADITASFVDTACWFDVKGSYPSRNFFHLRTGLDVSAEKISTIFSLFYDARMNRSFVDQSFYLTGEYNF